MNRITEYIKEDLRWLNSEPRPGMYMPRWYLAIFGGITTGLLLWLVNLLYQLP